MLSPVDPAKPPLAVLFGLSGLALTQEESDFFRQVNPLGFILFARNAQDPQQLSALNKSLHACLGREVPILIDQEGGRVARLRPPHWPSFPAAKTFGDARDESGAYQNATQLAAMLRNVGVNVNCTPVLDVLFPDTHAAIGDRAFSSDPALVGRLAEAVCRGHLAEQIIPVVKHMPGQGRANMDSHTHLPIVTATMSELEAADFAPYRHLLKQDFAHAVWGMVSHIVYTAIDKNNPATCSSAVTDGVIRKSFGFDGFLLSDDIVMNALAVVGDMGQRTVQSIAAGCDAVLHCNGVMAEMKDVAAKVPVLSADGVRRYNASIAPLNVPPPATPIV